MPAQVPIPLVPLPTEPDQPPHANLQLKPMVKLEAAQPSSARPHNLDQLISDCAKAEAYLDSMMSEMKGRIKGGNHKSFAFMDSTSLSSITHSLSSGVIF
jgi:hypothetical protein